MHSQHKNLIEKIKEKLDNIFFVELSPSVYNPIQCNHIYKYSHQERKQTNSTGYDETVYDVVVCEKCGDVKRNQAFIY